VLGTLADVSLTFPAAPPKESARAHRKTFRRNGIPWFGTSPDEPLPKRLLTRPLFYVFVGMLLVDAAAITALYFTVIPTREVPGGQLLGIGNEALWNVTRYGVYTVVPLTLVFLWLDRYRPQRFWVWLMAFLWGACVATYLSANINSWAAGHLAIQGNGDPASGARAAIYVAPFVEEATKATVLFWLAILMRYRWVSRHSAVVLAGLSAAGFAFVENLIYYGRLYVAAANTYGASRPEDLVSQLFFIRGVMTCFGHPLFTTMTGIGLAVALRSKSKVVRVVAPLAGFMAAALLHMAFNATVSLLPQGPALIFMYVVALGFLATVIIFVVRGLLAQGRLIRQRLTDYVRMGWLPASDPEHFGRLRPRMFSLLKAVPDGPWAVWDTIRIERVATELAYLRDAMVRGLVDRGGHEREAQLIGEIAQLRPNAQTGATLRDVIQRARQINLRRRPGGVADYPAPSYPGPAGIGGSWPAPNGPSWAPTAQLPPPGQVPPPGSFPRPGQAPAGQFPPPVEAPRTQSAASAAPPWAPPTQPGTVTIGPAAQQYSKVDPTWSPPDS